MKKIIKTIIAGLLALSFCPVIASAADDISGNKFEKDLRLIIGLGIMNGYEDGNFRPEAQITRAEFVTLLMRTLGWDSIATVQAMFSDTDGHWAEGYINKSKELEISHGNDDGTFKPNEPISYQEAVAFVVNALGYANVVESQGGYPAGYLNIGNQIGLLTGVGVAYNAPVTRAEVAKLISNALEAETLEFGGDSYKKGETLLEKIQYTVIEGKVDSVWGGSIYGQKLSQKNSIIIGGKKYKTSFTPNMELLGAEVKAYIYDYDESDEEVRYIEISQKTSSLSIDTEDVGIVRVGDSMSYYSGKSNKTVKFDSGIVVLKNGDLLPSSAVTPAVFKLNEGKVVLIDNNDDMKYDVALIWEFKEYIVNRVSSDRIYCEYNKSVDLTDINNDMELTIVYDGEEISVDDLNADDVIAVAENDSKTKVRIEVTRKKAYGTIKGISEDDYGDTITKKFSVMSDDETKEIFFSYSYNEEYNSSHGYFKKPEINETGALYLNRRGEIMLFSAGEMPDADSDEEGVKQEDYKYGYLIDASYRGANETLLVKMLTQDNTIEKIKTVEKVKIGAKTDGSYQISRIDSANAYDIVAPQGTVTKQLIKYKLDGEGILKELYLSKGGENTKMWGATGESLTREFANYQLEQQYVVDATTMCFYIPSKTDETEWKATKAVTMLKSGSSYKTTLYDIVDGKVGVVFYTPTLATTKYKYILDYVNSPVMLIDKVSEKFDENEGENVKVISGWQSGEYKEVAVAKTLENNSDSADNLKKGMLIQYLLNSEKKSFAYNRDLSDEIILFNKICDFNNLGSDFITWDYSSLTDNNARIKVYKGVVTYVEDDTFYVEIDGNTYVAVMHGGTTVLRYNPDTDDEPKKADLKDVAVGNTVLVRQRYNNTRDVFILK